MSETIAIKKYKNNSSKLKKQFIKSLSEYLKSQKYHQKITNAILDESFINSNPLYYTYYPHLFNNAFKIFDKDILCTLSLAGFLYYKAILNIDKIFDEKEAKDSFQEYIIANICQEETIKLLSKLFPTNHPFWKLWNKRKMEYINACQDYGKAICNMAK